MTIPETYRLTGDGFKRYYWRKAYKKARHKKAARRLPVVGKFFER